MSCAIHEKHTIVRQAVISSQYETRRKTNLPRDINSSTYDMTRQKLTSTPHSPRGVGAGVGGGVGAGVGPGVGGAVGPGVGPGVGGGVGPRVGGVGLGVGAGVGRLFSSAWRKRSQYPSSSVASLRSSAGMPAAAALRWPALLLRRARCFRVAVLCFLPFCPTAAVFFAEAVAARTARVEAIRTILMFSYFSSSSFQFLGWQLDGDIQGPINFLLQSGKPGSK